MSVRERPLAMRGRAVLLAAALLFIGAGGLLGARLAGAERSAAVPVAVPQAVSAEPSVAVPVTPFRVLDTRVGIGTGGSTAPLGAGATITVQIAGVGTVPANATGVVLNITSNSATSAGYVTAWPHGEPMPTASVLNLTPGQDLPNMITASLGDGQLDLYNFAGSVHLIADVAAYLLPGAGGGEGPQGPPGPAGPSAWDPIPSGVTVTGSFAGTAAANPPGLTWQIAVDLPGVAPEPLTDATVNLFPLGGETPDADPGCTGTFSEPTAPPGKVCVYAYQRANISTMYGDGALAASTSFLVLIVPGYGNPSAVYGSWAYTAP
jgi:hypothetical protein